MATFKKTSYTTDDYVQDGLLLHFDGINNTGSGHDDNATAWKDLSTNGCDAAASGSIRTPIWRANGAEWPDDQYQYAFRFAASAALAAKAGKSMTLEIVATDNDMPYRDGLRMFVLKPFASSSGWNFSAMAMALWRGIFFANLTGGSGWGGDFQLGIGRGMSIQSGYASVLTTNNELSVTAVLDTENNKYVGYYRGVKCGERAYKNFVFPTTVTEGWIGPDDGNQRGFVGRIHAIRLYDRILTPAEIAANHEIDDLRYYQGAVRTDGVPARYGSPVPEYGTASFLPGSVQTFSIADSLIEYDDGQSAIRVNDLKRAFPTNCLVKTRDGGEVVHDNADLTFDVTVSAALKAIWSFRTEYGLSASSTGGGTVSVNGGASAAQNVNWGEDGRSVTLRATASSGYEFAGWTGDLEGVADPTLEEITVNVSTSKTVVATFEPSAYSSSTYVQDGLVLQFDGIDNDIVDDVRCHNPNATAWKDLTGYGSDAGRSQSYLNMPVWTDFGPEWPSTTELCQLKFQASPQLQAVSNTAWTVEFVATDTGMTRVDGMGIFTLMPAKSNLVPFAVCWWRNIFFMNASGGWGKGGHIPLALNTDCQGGYAGGNYCVDREIAVAFTCPADYSRTDGYYQGRSVGGSTITFARPTQAIEYGFIGSDNVGTPTTAKGFKGRIHSIRVYNRILSASEVAFNHRIDRKRFFDGVVRVEAMPSEYGAPSPAYGVHNFAPRSTQRFTIADSLVRYPDGVWAIDSGLVRTALADCRVAAGDTVLHSGGEAAFDCKITTNCTATWTFDVQYALRVVSPAQGTVSVNDGAASLCVTNWGVDGRSVRVVATPADGYRFVSWSGDTEGLSDVTAADVTVTVSSPRTLTATFAEAHHEPTTCTWKEGVTQGSWSDNANWADGAVPDTGDTVILPSAAKISLDVPTAELAALTLGDGATLSVSKWTSAIRAQTVTVGTGATILAAGPFLDGAESNRVWIVGETLTVQAGGRISADAAGYAGTNGPAWVGVSPTLYNVADHRDACPFGGSYGGEQGYMWPAGKLNRGWNDGYREFGPQTYGSAEWPYAPGSGGGYVTRAGGGAIFLDMTGTIRIDGRVSADAMTASEVRNYSQASYGSGGGILVNCAKIVGTGVVSASCDIPEQSIHGTVGSVMSGGGGGGRIAVHYDTAVQTTEDCKIRFLARGGLFHDPSCDKQFSRWGGASGTLWFSDNRFLAAMAGDCPFAGTWTGGVALDEVSFTGSTVFTNGCFRLVGKSVAFGGDVTLGGAPDGAFAPYGLELQDCETTVAGSVDVAGARLAVKGGTLSVAGDLRQKNRAGKTFATTRGGDFLALAAPTNGTDGSDGALITVGGRWTMESNAVAYVKCDPTNGAAVAFHVGYFEEAEGAMVDARAYGWKFGVYSGPNTASPYGPAPGVFGGAGAGHIGLGGGNSAPKYASYDSTERPTLPGSGGKACPGGGVIRIVADRHMRIAGSICADSYNPMADNGTTAGGAGGTVYLSCKRLTGFPSAKISASANVYGQAYGGDDGSGGGGAIAIWCANNKAPSWTDESGILNASANYDPTKAVSSPPTDGSVYWGKNPADGLRIIVR